MEPVDVYLMYCALKAHFGKGQYDYHKYHGKTKITRASFYKRKDRYFFTKIAKKFNSYKEAEGYLVSNFIRDRKGYIVNFNDENYDSWKLRRQGFFEMFPVEMVPFVENFEPIFKVTDMQHPTLMKEYLGGRVSLESLIILDVLVEFSPDWDKKLHGDIVWESLKKLMKDYKGFLTIDPKRYRMKLLNLIEESN